MNVVDEKAHSIVCYQLVMGSRIHCICNVKKQSNIFEILHENIDFPAILGPVDADSDDEDSICSWQL